MKKVADAYKLDRRTKRTFRADAAQPYDDRCLSWQPDQQSVSIWTVAGRLKGIRFAVGEQQRKLLAHRKGESDLVYRNGKLYLYATCEISEASVVAPNGFLGVDLGVVNVATTSDGTRYAGKHLNRIRHRNQRLRAKLQHKGTKSAKRAQDAVPQGGPLRQQLAHPLCWPAIGPQRLAYPTSGLGHSW